MTFSFWPWFLQNWSRAGIVIAIFLVVIFPFLLNGMPVAALAVYAQLPLYMVHQYEEHAHGAFKDFVNREIGHGRELLNDTAIFWINVGAVWLLDLVVLYLTVYVQASLGLIAIYLTLINGLLHVIAAIISRRYNPGLLTSLILFLPVGGYTLLRMTEAIPLTLFDHAVGIGVGIMIHLGLIIPVQVRMRTSPSPVQTHAENA